MARVQGAWTTKTVNGRMVSSCTQTINGSIAENDIYTLKTPKELNPTKPWTLIFNVTEDVTAAGTSALDIWGGYADDFAMTGNDTTVAATSGGLLAALSTDVDAGGVFTVRVVPGNEGGPTQVTTLPGLIILPPMPYYAFNIDCTAVVQDDINVDFIIVQ